jgi:ATP-binding protein involved in chromosome partitioning
VPLDPRLRESGDAGTPLVESDPDSDAGRAIMALAETIVGTRREQGVGIVKSLPVLS